MPRDAFDELFGCNDLGDCLGEDTPMEGVFDDIGGFLADAGKTVVKGVAKAGKAVMDSPITKVVLPVTALANSKIGLAVASKIPGGDKLVAAGKTATGMIDKLAGSGGGSSAPVASTGPYVPRLQALLKPGASEVKAAGRAAALAGGLAGKIAAKKAANARMAQTALAAPVPMSTATEPMVKLNVSPYGQSDLAAAIEAQFGGKLSEIAGKLRTMQLQTQATSEHRSLAKEQAFKRAVLNSLKRISTNTQGR